jgi:hypothetical protein
MKRHSATNVHAPTHMVKTGRKETAQAEGENYNNRD